MNRKSQFLTHIQDYDAGLRTACFAYFYWFSRFEFALKENKYIVGDRHDNAMADWTGFEGAYKAKYSLDDHARALLHAPPQTQVYANSYYRWGGLDLNRADSELGKVILIVKTIRNNLFHGGKSSHEDWDNPERNTFLLTTGKLVLDSLADLSDFRWDYYRIY